MPNSRHRTNSILQKMALRRPIDYVTKPIAFFVAILSVYIMVEFGVEGADHSIKTIKKQAPIVVLTALPFVIASLVVISKLDCIHNDLAQLALTDALTNLPNRRSFSLQVDNLQTNGAIGFLLILDADHFKRVNDTYGHAVGDDCLRAIADRLRETRRPDDVYGRIGGEEFGAYLPDTTAADLRKIGDVLCKGIHIEIAGLDAPLRITMSVGATETHPDEDVTRALQRADEALYVAKSTGRARMVSWSKSMADKIA